MKTYKFITAALIFVVFAGSCSVFPTAKKSAKKSAKAPPSAPAKSQPIREPSAKARNIYALFTQKNPRLAPESAKKYAEYVIEAAGKFGQDPYVIAAIIVHESTVNNKAVSKGGDYGLMQVRWKVHEKAIKQRFPKVKRANDMFDARTNIMFGTEIFADGMRRSGNDTGKGLLRYSAGNTKLRDKVLATVKELRSREKSQNTSAAQRKKNTKGK